MISRPYNLTFWGALCQYVSQLFVACASSTCGICSIFLLDAPNIFVACATYFLADVFAYAYGMYFKACDMLSTTLLNQVVCMLKLGNLICQEQ